MFTTGEESRAHLEQTCAGVLNGNKLCKLYLQYIYPYQLTPSRTLCEHVIHGPWSVCMCSEVKDDSSLVASLPDAFAVYLHLPYMGHTCFLFQQGDERGHFLSVLKTCIRHSSLGKTQTLTRISYSSSTLLPLFETCIISTLQNNMRLI